DPAGLEQLIDEVIGWFRRHPDYEELKGLFTALVKQAIAGIGGAVPLPDDLVEIKTMLATQGEAWKRQWLAEGRAEGKVEGKAEGKVEGKAEALLRLIEKRFGLPRTDLRERIQDADAALIEAWFDRAIDAPDIETIFATPN
ncbi:MAG: hypothetical protein P4M00_22255, partial [Azospirillaceae bacterium]|nr:hypothetical protein [Azospirillaceae bacterium]